MPETTVPQLTDVAASLDFLLVWQRRHAPSSGYSTTARMTLIRLADDGPARITDLARHEAVTQPAMTGLVNRLETEGLVRREPDPRDARAALVVLTEAGTALILARRSERARSLAGQIERLSPTDQQALLDAVPALDRLAAQLGR